jgi:hypothetical protein
VDDSWQPIGAPRRRQPLIEQPLERQAGALGSLRLGCQRLIKSHGWGSHVIEFFSLVTAIVATDQPAQIDPPVQVLDLNDR